MNWERIVYMFNTFFNNHRILEYSKYGECELYGCGQISTTCGTFVNLKNRKKALKWKGLQQVLVRTMGYKMCCGKKPRSSQVQLIGGSSSSKCYCPFCLSSWRGGAYIVPYSFILPTSNFNTKCQSLIPHTTLIPHTHAKLTNTVFMAAKHNSFFTHPPVCWH